ncbi:hypothetical protein [Pseudarthrobacter sp. SSS035]|uniref:hypothetical protein n=1 Tax=Pseudarthrobacter sp. SSS035 TaxID=2931399 RepID=UPI00200FB173|nr:hypothetical protein [Pseudarthrobacter sp. SSS035]
MSTDRPVGWLRRWFLTARRSFLGGAEGGKESAVVDPSLGNVQLQLTVWEQRL